MKLRKPAWQVVLIVEDDTDGRACRELARAAGVRATIDWLPANGIGNIKRKGSKLIGLARDRCRKRGCVAVLIDRDQKEVDSQEPHRTIAKVCRDEMVPLIIAREALEAWFLADAEICRWLGLGPVPNTASLSAPKDIVARAFRSKTGRPYMKGRARIEVARRASGPDPNRNSSLAEGLRHIAKCKVLELSDRLARRVQSRTALSWTSCASPRSISRGFHVR